MKRLLLVFSASLLAFPAYATSTLYSDSSTGSVAIGTTSPTTGVALDLGSNTNSMLLPVGTTGDRPTGVAGMLRYNSTNSVPEFYTSSWLPVPLTASAPIVIDSDTGNISCPTCSGGAGVTSVSGDGALISNSGSTGAVTLVLGDAPAYTVWGNNTSSSATPTYTNSPELSGAITDLQSVGATSTDGLVLLNSTAATSGNQEWSPRLRWTGQGWKTDATAASQEVDAVAELQPVQGAANPSFNWVLSGQIGGGGYSPLLTVPSGGGLNLNSGVYEINGTQLAASNLLNGVNGSGSIVLTISPSLTTPDIGAAAGTSLAVTGNITTSAGQVAIGTTTPTTGAALDLGSNTNSMLLPAGTTGDRPTGVAGMLRYNESIPGVEAYYGGTWNTLGAGNDTRTRLTGDQTFYISTTGSDSNDCLTSGTACATLNYVWNLIAETYDLAGYTATIQLADGTYTSGLTARIPVLGGTVVIDGDSGTPSNVVLSITGGNCLVAVGPGVTFQVQNLEMTTTGAGYGDISADRGAYILMGSGLIFGSVDSSSGHHISAQGGGAVYIYHSYSIVGGGAFHYYTADGSLIRVASSVTATLTGTPAFGQDFASATEASQIVLPGITYSGSATGTRYIANLNGVIDTGGGGSTFLPGNAAGSTATGGQYN